MRRALIIVTLSLAWVPAIPSEEMDPDLCAVCHQEVDAWLERSNVHAPFSAQRCLNCHAAHASRHSGLLRMERERLCLDCHAPIADSLGAGRVHRAIVGEEGCLGCHEPHASEVSRLLTGEQAELCLECHEPIRARQEAAFGHEPFEAGVCSSCHDPHVSPHPALLHTEGDGLCTGCHDLSDAAAPAGHLGKIPAGSCGSCHDPHGSAHAGVLRAVLHTPFESGDCTFCHDPDAAEAPYLSRPPEKSCSMCHAERARQAASPRHPGNCTDCHSPHAGATNALLKDGTSRTCIACHGEIGDEFAGEEHGHPLSQGCIACHDPHDGSDDGLLADGGAPATCNGCHQSHATFSHPMGKGIEDPSRPGKSLDCLSCHAPHASDYEAFLLADANRDLCMRCHDTEHDARERDAAEREPR